MEALESELAQSFQSLKEIFPKLRLQPGDKIELIQIKQFCHYVLMCSEADQNIQKLQWVTIKNNKAAVMATTEETFQPTLAGLSLKDCKKGDRSWFLIKYPFQELPNT